MTTLTPTTPDADHHLSTTLAHIDHTLHARTHGDNEYHHHHPRDYDDMYAVIAARQR
ncbi:hypothetical protein SCLCIDRAFT_1223251 [Scleroderma citrinum Foug A]|uniref:Uncharacterized protein n=1 Tax=Scleroderma citrinum Foug A TaxID=1036808 RepID=A0A0C3D9B3_9AGAM|nr:hypothetical protein SCLCIDRAFT_1223251 [Scleroderma citrinum Foug A]